MDNQCASEMVVGYYVCEWYTGGKLVEGVNKLVSQRFYAGVERQTEWELYLFPNEQTKGLKDRGSLCLKLKRGWPVTVIGNIEIRILKEPERILRDPLPFRVNFDCENFVSFQQYVCLSEIMKPKKTYIKKIKIICKLVIDEKPEQKFLPYCRTVDDLKIRSRDFLSMLHFAMNSDVHVCVENGAFIHAHKFILKARSRKFATMLRSDPPAIFIKLPFDVANELLSYIYGAKFSQWQRDIIRKLATIAGEYEVMGLFEACLDFLGITPLSNGGPSMSLE